MPLYHAVTRIGTVGIRHPVRTTLVPGASATSARLNTTPDPGVPPSSQTICANAALDGGIIPILLVCVHVPAGKATLAKLLDEMRTLDEVYQLTPIERPDAY